MHKTYAGLTCVSFSHSVDYGITSFVYQYVVHARLGPPNSLHGHVVSSPRASVDKSISSQRIQCFAREGASGQTTELV